MQGWRVTLVGGGGTAALALLLAMQAPDAVEACRQVIRLTARTSLLFFLAAFAASALVRRFPSAPTLWLRANRRYVGLAFAVSHLIHLVAFVTLARLDPILFDQLTNIVTFVGGGLAYVCVAILAATSFDGAVRAIGAAAWRRGHLIASWYIWLSFALNFGKRIPISSLYLVPTLAILLVGLLRVAGQRRMPA